MKYSEMNARQRKAFNNIKWAANVLIGETLNTTYDYPEDSEECKQAVELLANHDELVKRLYEMATTAIYEDGFYCENPMRILYELRHINFCGTEWLMGQCEARIVKEGY